MSTTTLPQKTGALAPVPKYQEIEQVVDECSLNVSQDTGRMQRAMVLAAGIRKLQELITDKMVTEIMGLQGTALGFITDKDSSGGYPEPVVKACFIEAMLLGVQPIGNEWNIIASRPYITKNGFARLVRDTGITNLKLNLDVPTIKEQGATVPTEATWEYGGDEQSIKRTFPIRVNQRMGADAVLGKATRKLLAAIYQQITGSEHALPEGDVQDIDYIEPATTKAGQSPPTGRHKAGRHRTVEPKQPDAEAETIPDAVPVSGPSEEEKLVIDIRDHFDGRKEIDFIKFASDKGIPSKPKLENYLVSELRELLKLVKEY